MKPATSNHAAFAIALVLLLLLLFAAVQPASADPGWYDAEWAYRKSITIDHDKVDSTQTNFPVLISLTSDGDLAADAQDNGNDILFTISTDETTKLSHEIEEFDGGTGELIAWVKVDSLSGSADTVLYMYYGNLDCTSRQDPTNVWDGNYKNVWHLKESCAVAGCIKDSTTNNDGTPYSGVHITDLTTSGKIDGADAFDGSDDYVDVSGVGRYTTGSTWSAWFNTATITSGYTAIIGYRECLNQYAMDDHVNIYAKDGFGGGDGWQLLTSITTLSTNTWYLYTAVHTGTALKLYINGVYDTEIAVGSLTPDAAFTSTHIGLRANSQAPFEGKIDEVRVSNIVRGAGWIKTGYNNQVDATPGGGHFIKPLGGEVTNWKSYKDSDHSEECESFSDANNHVYMNGDGFSISQTLKVGYYDGAAGGGGAKTQTETYTNGVAGGSLNSQYIFTNDSAAAAGSWHAVVLQQAAALPPTYSAAVGDVDYIVDDGFTVAQSAIPEFPTVVTAIAVCMLCAVAYVVMRRKVGDG